jgi:hypothetical protein
VSAEKSLRSCVGGSTASRMPDASGAEGCRVVIADGAGDRVGGWGRLGASPLGEVLSQRESGRCIESKIVCASAVALCVLASSGC